ncbi:nitrite reductase small subunit NirD [Microbispora sp. NPDC046933]|uniref:nitrite reductase small subunit NirD n=1 Tax=Microbispora sp. NPDC046933 TaxID=3155618 RepID=UPI0033D13393
MTVLDSTAPNETLALSAHWTPVCSYTDLLPERGAAVLVGDRQVAVFRTFDGALYALGNLDPFSGAYVMSRGIVGTRNGEPTVASPMHKQVFSLVTGVCVDDSAVAVPTYPIRVTDGTVEVSAV